MASGVQPSGLVYGGTAPATGVNDQNTSWNGTSWTVETSLNTARRKGGGAGVDSTSALASGGDNPSSTPEYFSNTESWNGTTWTELNNMSTARDNVGGSGTQAAALIANGRNPTPVFSTEEWNVPGKVPRTIDITV
jgi:hypothetical protein